MKKTSTLFSLAFVVIGVFFIYTNAYGTTIFIDDFNSYNNAVLTGQGGWDGANTYSVQETISKEGKAVELNADGSSYTIYKYGTGTTTDGNIGMYLAHDDAGLSDGPLFKLYENTTYVARIGFAGGGDIYSYKNGGYDLIIENPVPDQWYWCEIEWASTPAHKIRYRVDDGEWSEWFDPVNDWTTGINRVQLEGPNGTNLQYWDFISDTPYEEEEQATSTYSDTVLWDKNMYPLIFALIIGLFLGTFSIVMRT